MRAGRKFFAQRAWGHDQEALTLNGLVKVYLALPWSLPQGGGPAPQKKRSSPRKGWGCFPGCPKLAVSAKEGT